MGRESDSARSGPVLVVARCRRSLWRRAVLVVLAAQTVWIGCGCASSGPYRYGKFHGDDYEPQPVVVDRGKPHKTLDRLAWCVGIPSKIFTLNPKTNNHNVSDETIELDGNGRG